jgi:hypothetical protein
MMGYPNTGFLMQGGNTTLGNVRVMVNALSSLSADAVADIAAGAGMHSGARCSCLAMCTTAVMGGGVLLRASPLW